MKRKADEEAGEVEAILQSIWWAQKTGSTKKEEEEERRVVKDSVFGDIKLNSVRFLMDGFFYSWFLSFDVDAMPLILTLNSGPTWMEGGGV